MLKEGIGAPADQVAACAWLEVASLDGSAEARQERNLLLPNLSPAQQAEAVRQATALRSGPAKPAAAARRPGKVLIGRLCRRKECLTEYAFKPPR